MKYLFFDIECSNCFNGIGKICEFGYVLTDENFEIIQKDDIPMSPGKGRENRFNLTDSDGKVRVELAYDYDFYFSCPEFPKYYDRIKKLMADKDTICFAYSKENDIMHLYNSCYRYKLEPIDYVVYDVQLIAMKYLELKEQINQKKAYLKIVGPSRMIGLQEHLSRDDAYMEMQILEAVTVLLKTSVKQLLKEINEANTNSSDFVNEIVNKAKIRKEISERHNKFSNAGKNDYLTDKDYQNKVKYNVSGSLKGSCKDIDKIIELIHSVGGVVTTICSETNIFICSSEQDIEIVKSKLYKSEDITFVTYNDFKKQLNDIEHS